MENNKNTFIFHLEWAEILRGYPAEVRYEVYDAIIGYAQSGTLSEMKPLANMAFAFIKMDMDRDVDRYKEMCDKNKENGQRGGRPRNRTVSEKPNGFQENPKNRTVSEKPQYDNDYDYHSEDDNDYHSEGDKNAPARTEKFAPLNQNDVAFADFYKKKFATDFIWQENTSEAIQRIADNITDKLGELGGESPPAKMSDNITAFLEAVYNLGDNWLNQRFTPQLLAKQFNQLYNRIKNGSRLTENFRSRTDNPAGVSAAYLARIASELAGEVQ